MPVRVADLVVGVRVSEPATLQLTRALLAPLLVPRADAYPNLSLLVGGRRGPAQELHRLYRHCTAVTRTTSLRRLLVATVLQLGRFLPPPDGLVPLDVEVLEGDAGCVLLGNVATGAPVTERELAQVGWQRVDAGTPMLDPRRLDLVFAGSRLRVDWSVLDDVDEGGTGPAAWAQQSRPIRAVVLLGTQPDPVKMTSPARRLVSLASLVDQESRPARGEDLAALGRLAGRCEVVRTLGLDKRELLDVLRRL